MALQGETDAVNTSGTPEHGNVETMAPAGQASSKDEVIVLEVGSGRFDMALMTMVVSRE